MAATLLVEYGRWPATSRASARSPSARTARAAAAPRRPRARAAAKAASSFHVHDPRSGATTTVLADFTQFRRRRILLVVCLALDGLAHLQLRLGLGSNEDGSLLAFHIPVGVLVVLLTYLTVALGFGGYVEPSRA